MSTTTIRIPDELKSRLSRIAEQEGISTHGLILDAIAEKADALEQRQSLYAEAEARYAKVLQTGLAVTWNDMREYLDARMAGKHPPRPVPKPISE
jgi:predicted transcriptional regulator